MGFKLIRKFITAYIFLALAVFILISTVGSKIIENNIISLKSRQVYSEAQNIAADLTDKDESLDSLHTLLRYVAAYEGSEIWLMTDDGKIILNSANEYTGESDERVSGFDRVSLGSGYYWTGDFFGYFVRDRLTVMTPVSSNLIIQGYVVIHIPMSQIISLRESILATVHIVVILIFIIFFIILLLIFFWVINPLVRITKGAKEFAEGNLKYRIDLNNSDETGYLANTLNYMADELDKAGDRQRAFIANISHDFRSPLTSIKGYATAMQDGVIPPEMQSKYLGIVIAESDRLAKLSQEMLTLDKVNSRSQELKLSNFNINEMLKETAASFEGRCIQKNIVIDLIFEEEILMVNADYSKIQQVLYNLVDNAIKFSKANTTIEIESSKKQKKAYIRVSDHGIGISSNDISKIWDRFYKTDLSRGKDPKGSGLGLAIVKEILTAHGQKINVVSTPDVGTTFTFTLPSAISESL